MHVLARQLASIRGRTDEADLGVSGRDWRSACRHARGMGLIGLPGAWSDRLAETARLGGAGGRFSVSVGDDFRACRWFLRRVPWRGGECRGGRLGRSAAGASPRLGRGGWERHRLGWRSRPRAVILMAMRDRLRLARSAGRRFCSSSASRSSAPVSRGAARVSPEWAMGGREFAQVLRLGLPGGDHGPQHAWRTKLGRGRNLGPVRDRGSFCRTEPGACPRTGSAAQAGS